MGKIRENQSGFTMVEMIITIAIAGILAGIVGASLGIIRSGNAKKSASRLDSKLSTVQTENMTKEGKTFLYLYQDSGEIKAVAIAADSANPNGFTSRSEVTGKVSSAGLNATKVGGSGVTVMATGSSPSLTLDSSNMIKIGFDKATGAFNCCNSGSVSDTSFYNEISFSGSEIYRIKLVKATGKHFVK